MRAATAAPARARCRLSPGHGVELAARSVRARALPRLRRRGQQPWHCSTASPRICATACLGQVSEIFDGDAPLAPRGCFAQAWGVAETLRAWSDINDANSDRAAATLADVSHEPTRNDAVGRRAHATRAAAPAASWPGRSGVRISASASGARCARTTARTATPGTTSRTITRAAAPIAGAKTASRASRDDSSACASSLALWNSHDPILKERLFGLTNSEGNHGEDVKELYYYLDATPTHSYLKMLYKYPQRRSRMRIWSTRTAAAASARARVRAGRHRRVRRRTATSTCSSSTRRPTPTTC